MIVAIIILSILCLAFMYSSYNVYRKHKILIIKISEFIEMYKQFHQLLEYSSRRIKEIDSLGSFESDDEVGYFFKTIQEMQETLNKFFENNKIE